MKNNQTKEEAYVKKRFKKDGFGVVKLDIHNRYKSPDYKVSKKKLRVLVEVKVGFKKGTILETLSTGAFRFDPSTAIDDYFSIATNKFKEHVSHNPQDQNLPYIVIFTMPFFIGDELVWSDVPYKKYALISAVFIPKRTHPLDKKAKDMSLEELEGIINDEKTSLNSQTSLKWSVIKNPYAVNSLNTSVMGSVDSVLTPNSSV